MAKVYPKAPVCAPCCMSAERETFTIWMKSLVCHTNGCTVFDSKGQIVYRVDNYDRKCSSEVNLMDHRGKVLFTIRRKKLRVFGRWDGYRGVGGSGFSKNKEKPWFQVRKYCKLFMGRLSCEVRVGSAKYWIVSLGCKGKAAFSFRVVDMDGTIVAEVKHKQSSSGIMLGDDVLSLEVESQQDHSLVMALVTVYGLLNRKL